MKKTSEQLLWPRDKQHGGPLGQVSGFPEGQLAKAHAETERLLMLPSHGPRPFPPRLPPCHQAGCETAFLESLACAENWFPVKVSPVRKGTRIKVLLKETKGIFISSGSACFLLLWV